MDMLWGACHIPMSMYLLGRLEEINPLFESMGLHWSTALKTLDHW